MLHSERCITKHLARYLRARQALSFPFCQRMKIQPRCLAFRQSHTEPSLAIRDTLVQTCMMCVGMVLRIQDAQMSTWSGMLRLPKTLLGAQSFQVQVH